MADFETALRNRLKASAPITALAGNRIDWTVRPQATGGAARYPAVVLTTITDPRPRHMSGWNGQRPTRVQIDCYAKTAGEKVALREAVLATVAGGAVVSGVRFGPAQNISVTETGEDADGGFIHRDMIEIYIWQNKEA